MNNNTNFKNNDFISIIDNCYKLLSQLNASIKNLEKEKIDLCNNRDILSKDILIYKDKLLLITYELDDLKTQKNTLESEYLNKIAQKQDLEEKYKNLYHSVDIKQI